MKVISLILQGYGIFPLRLIYIIQFIKQNSTLLIEKGKLNDFANKNLLNKSGKILPGNNKRFGQKTQRKIFIPEEEKDNPGSFLQLHSEFYPFLIFWWNLLRYAWVEIVAFFSGLPEMI